GFLVIHSLHEMKIKHEQIGMIILVDASIGSIKPPITQGVIHSSSLIETDPSPVIKIAYISDGHAGVLDILESSGLVHSKKMHEHLKSADSLWKILKERWVTLIPLAVLVVIVVANTLFDYDIFAEWPFFAFILDPIREIPVLQGITFDVVTAIIIAIFVS